MQNSDSHIGQEPDEIVAETILAWLFYKHHKQIERLQALLGVPHGFSEKLDQLLKDKNKQ